jgi:hypothetical protein
MKSYLELTLNSESKIIFVDESMFTTSTRMSHAYSSRNKNILLIEMLMNNDAIAVVAGVSIEAGLDGFLTHPKSIDSDTFIIFLDNLRESNVGRQITLFMDNCSVHHSKKVTSYIKEHGLIAIFNVPYSPQYNPIERVWAIAKNEYKRRKL